MSGQKSGGSMVRIAVPRGCIAFYPPKVIFEIAIGFGLEMKFLIPNSARYIGGDLSLECVDACRRIFFNLSLRDPTFVKSDDASCRGSRTAVATWFSRSIPYTRQGRCCASVHPRGYPTPVADGRRFHSSIQSAPVKWLGTACPRRLAGLNSRDHQLGLGTYHDCLPKSARVDNPRFMDGVLVIRDFQAIWSKRFSHYCS
jgi:hypothetical protein